MTEALSPGGALTCSVASWPMGAHSARISARVARQCGQALWCRPSRGGVPSATWTSSCVDGHSAGQPVASGHQGHLLSLFEPVQQRPSGAVDTDLDGTFCGAEQRSYLRLGASVEGMQNQGGTLVER